MILIHLSAFYLNIFRAFSYQVMTRKVVLYISYGKGIMVAVLLA